MGGHRQPNPCTNNKTKHAGPPVKNTNHQNKTATLETNVQGGGERRHRGVENYNNDEPEKKYTVKLQGVPVYVQQVRSWLGVPGPVPSRALARHAACTVSVSALLSGQVGRRVGGPTSAVEHDDVAEADLLRVVDDVLVVVHQGGLALVLHGLHLAQRHHGTCERHCNRQCYSPAQIIMEPYNHWHQSSTIISVNHHENLQSLASTRMVSVQGSTIVSIMKRIVKDRTTVSVSLVTVSIWVCVD